MTLPPIECDTCGPLTSFEFDGYAFGDRILEDVIFVAEQQPDGHWEVRSKDAWDTDPYLSGLSEQHWLKRAREYLKALDIATCPTCGADIDLVLP